jgi:hypothetical protein
MENCVPILSSHPVSYPVAGLDISPIFLRSVLVLRELSYTSELSFAVIAKEEMKAETQPYSCHDLYML